MINKKWDTYVTKGICIYFFLFLLYSLTGRILPVNYFIGDKINQIIYLFFAVSGVVFIILDLVGGRYQFKGKYAKILYLFIGIMIISSLINIKFGYVENLKTIVWTYIQIALFYSLYTRIEKERLEKVLKIAFIILSTIWSMAVLISFLQFVLGDTYFYKYYQNGITGIRNQGIFDGRLYGIFNDPNFASVTSVYVLIMLVYLFTKRKKKGWNTIVYIDSILLNYIFIFLSGSRTAIIALAGGMFVCIFLQIKNKLLDKKRVFVYSTIVSFVCVLLFVMGGVLLKRESSKLPSLYQKYTSTSRNHIVKGEVLVKLLRGRDDVKVYWNYSYEKEILPNIMSEDNGEEQISSKKNDKVDDNSENSAVNTPSKEEIRKESRVNQPLKENNSTLLVQRGDVKADNITSNRTKIWKDYLKAMKGRYIIGTSPRNMMQYLEATGESEYVVERKYETHNGFLSLFVGCGIVGASIILIFVILVSKRVLKYSFRKDNIANEFIFLFSILAVVLIYTCAFTELFFVNNLTTTLFWTLLGSLWCWIDEGEKSASVENRM